MHDAPMLDMNKDGQVARLMPVSAPDECRARSIV